VLPPLNVHTRKSFVRQGVKENAATKVILDTVFPYFPAECRCITGHLDYADQYWPVNYHWDALLQKIDRFLSISSIPAPLLGSARAIRAQLMSNTPDPVTGYCKDVSAGDTKDRSTNERMEARFVELRRAKLNFESTLVKSGFIDPTQKANPSPEARVWWSVLGPVPAPSGSQHATGYALDIAGPFAEIARISTRLGATLAIAEGAHTHTEWSEGVTLVPFAPSDRPERSNGA
jgi:hypothetical protein